MELTWHESRFDALTPHQLYAMLRLRQQVFVVEQNCVYLDVDGVDPVCRHLWAERGGDILAYLRIVPVGVKYVEASIGRVITAPGARGTGIGRELMRRGVEATGRLSIRIGAQAYLEKFYGDFGFVRVSDVYMEDGIPHIEMLRNG